MIFTTLGSLGRRAVQRVLRRHEEAYTGNKTSRKWTQKDGSGSQWAHAKAPEIEHDADDEDLEGGWRPEHELQAGSSLEEEDL